MTDTVNKQALDDRLSESTLSEMYERADRARGYEAHLSSDLFDAINALEAAYAYIDSTPPTTPVQGYREDNVVKRARERCRAGNIDDDYVMRLAREIEALRLTNSRLQRDAVMFMEALSQTDIQPIGASDRLFRNARIVEGKVTHGFRKGLKPDEAVNGCGCTLCYAARQYAKAGINSTEDQPGPSISKTEEDESK